ncbi:hypothetical protein F5148DRAFT_1285321 [Russula earlei]|uniref:Uncharacterized protein n=1 Tax=Russula earlei TaxID=71964 RepID=A0ACC0U910_9AGAM|nr:hypothetical protein F5148DRAFT_1285321 [Russula earlei]
MTHTEWAQEDRTSICAGSVEIQMDPCDRSLAEVDHISPTDEHMQDPERFYALDSPISHNSDLEEEQYATPEEEWYATAEDLEEVLEPEDHSGEQPGPSYEPEEVPTTPVSLPPPTSQSSSHQPILSSQLEINHPPLGQSQLTSQLGSHTPIIGPLHQTLEGQNRDPRSVGGRTQEARRRRSPQQRGIEEKALAKLVWVELASLLIIEPPYGRTPEPSRLVAFAAQWERTGHGMRACEATASDFMIDIAGTPKSPWNMGYDDTVEMRKAIEKVFCTRVKSLKSHHKSNVLSQAEKAVEKSKHSRWQRKYQLFHRCRDIVKQYEPLQWHLPILDTLGVDGMSSDKSDLDPATNQINWLKVFDQLHHRSHLNGWSNDKRGAFAHLRVGSQKVHEKVYAPPGLPPNAYNPQWLEGRETLLDVIAYVLPTFFVGPYLN